MEQLENHRVELTALCNRMLGPVDGEDAVQETFVRALRSFDQFERRGTLRSWLYRASPRTCFDMLDSRKRRARPIELGIARDPTADSQYPGESRTAASSGGRSGRRHRGARGGPACACRSPCSTSRPSKRAVLILCEVPALKASEVAELLETSVTSVSRAHSSVRDAEVEET